MIKVLYLKIPKFSWKVVRFHIITVVFKKTTLTQTKTPVLTLKVVTVWS